MYLGGRYQTLFYQDLAKALLHGEDLLHLHRREVAPFHQDVAQLLVGGVSIGAAAVVDQVNGEFAIVLDKDEDILDRFAAPGGGEDNIPVEETVLRYQAVQCRHGIQVADHFAGAQFAQFVQQGHRVGASQHDFRQWPETDPIAAGGGVSGIICLDQLFHDRCRFC